MISRKTLYWLLRCSIALFFVLPITIFLYIWFGPIRTGEARPSPDNQYMAHAYNVYTRDILGSKEWCIELRVVEQSSGREVWRVVHQHVAGAKVPDYGSRVGPFVKWAADSTSVTVPVADGRDLVMTVP